MEKKLDNLTVIRLVLFLILLFFLLWGISGTILYWEAWIYFGAIFSAIGIAIKNLVRKDPEFLKRRLNKTEERPLQKKLALIGTPIYTAIYLFPALDKRFEWSIVPLWLKIVGLIIAFTGFFLMISVLRINQWASRTIEVREQQQVISVGPYAIIRHPMYLGLWIMFLGTPIALNSYWGLIPSFGSLILLIIRLIDEEKILLNELPGYAEYCKKTHYRLFPGIF